MKERGKAVAVSSSNWFSDYSSLSDLPCRKHPSSSSAGGICAYCLKDRLVKLVCSDCGEQRLSSCSCSDISSSYTAAEVGSVGRISFLIENEKEDIPHSNTIKPGRPESTVLLKRSSSSSVDVKRSGGFWKFGRLFRKKRDKGGLDEFSAGTNNGGGFDEKGEMWVFHNVGVSRSRSVGGGFRGGFDDSESGFRVSSGGASELNRDGHIESAKRSGGFNGVDTILSGSSGGKNGGLLESEGGLKKDDPSLLPESGFKGVRRSGITELDGGFNGENDSGFIDLKLGFSSESKPEFSFLKNRDLFETESGLRVSRDGDFSEHESDAFSYLRGERIFSNGGSCRITVDDTEIKKCRKSLKVWRWIFKNHSGIGRTVCKKHKEHVIKS